MPVGDGKLHMYLKIPRGNTKTTIQSDILKAL